MNLKELFTKEPTKEDKKADKTMEAIRERIKSGKYILYIGELVQPEDGSEDRLDHFVTISTGFKDDDVPLCCDAFRNSAGDMIHRNKETKKDTK